MIYEYSIERAAEALTVKPFTPKSKYYKDIITFDIETTSYNELMSWMYVWQVCINGTCLYGRTWDEFIEFIEYLTAYPEHTFVVWVHNLSFEFAFLQAVLKWNKVFATSPHKVLYAEYENIIFRCSYFMSNLSLAKLSTVYQLPVEKAVGDLDYKLIRHQSTPLTPQELYYIENDVLVLYYYIKHMLSQYGTFSTSKMPLTSTGFTRLHLRKVAKELNCYGSMRVIVREASPRSVKDYHMMQRAFAGGYTHANSIYVKHLLRGIRSRDKTSFYPSLMIRKKYPRHFFKAEPGKFFDLIQRGYAVIADVCFKNVVAKSSLTTISKHKCSLIKGNPLYKIQQGENGYDPSKDVPSIDNGRVYAAKTLVTTITELDYKTIAQFYDIGDIKIGRCIASKKRYLPKALIKSVLDLYAQKTELKDVEGKEQEYQRLKALLNSLYGCCVTDITQTLITFDTESCEWGQYTPTKEEWETETDAEAKTLYCMTQLHDYVENWKSILLYQTGIYITAYARHELLEHNWYIGADDIVYNDTDSIKYYPSERSEAYFAEYDKKAFAECMECIKYYKLDPELLTPKDIKGREHPLGLMPIEEDYDYFKTLGCKRYVCMPKGSNKLKCTLAGLSKKSCANYLLSGYQDEDRRSSIIGPPTIEQIFDKFCDQMYVPSAVAAKNTHYYTKPQNALIVTDYLGNKETVKPGYGISLIPQPFEINLSAAFRSFLSSDTVIESISHCERLRDINEMTKVNTLWEDL